MTVDSLFEKKGGNPNLKASRGLSISICACRSEERISGRRRGGSLEWLPCWVEARSVIFRTEHFAMTEAHARR